jgi:hypothetical protein
VPWIEVSSASDGMDALELLEARCCGVRSIGPSQARSREGNPFVLLLIW